MTTSAKKILLFIVSSVVCLTLLEGSLRALGFSYPAFFQPDPQVGTIHRPGAEGWYRSEGEAYVRINAVGFRDVHWSLEKPQSTFRIAVLGDSFTDALQVDLAATYSKQLEKLLGSCRSLHGSKVEVLNFGVSGFGTMQQLLTFRHFALKYNPDLVLVAFFSGNDVRNNSKKLDPDKLRPFPILKDGAIEADMSFTQLPRFQELSGSIHRAWRYLSFLRTIQAISYLKNNIFVFRNGLVDHRKPADGEIGLNDAIFLRSDSDEWTEAWLLTEAILRQLMKEVESAGGRMFLATLSVGIQVNPDANARDEYAKRLGVKDLTYPDARLQRFAEQIKLPHIILAPLLLQIAEHDKAYLHGFSNTGMGIGHWNEKGHAWAARLIASAICEQSADGWAH